MLVLPVQASQRFCSQQRLDCRDRTVPSKKALARRQHRPLQRSATAAIVTLVCVSTVSTARAIMSTATKRIAVAQLCSTNSKGGNLFRVAQCAAQAKSKECAMLFLPECFGFIGSSADETLQAAEPPFSVAAPPMPNSAKISKALTDIVESKEASDLSSLALSPDEEQGISLLDGLRCIAQASSMWISAGGMHVMVPGEDRVYNTHLILDDTGSVRAQYQKIHLFDVSIPGKVELRESKTTKAGSQLVVCPDSPIGTFAEIYWRSAIAQAF
jgi:deaminated glutathione amidase